MAEPVYAPYGTWTSSISALDVAVHTWRLGWTDYVGPELWWTRPTPGEGGRVRLYRASVNGTGAGTDPDDAPVLPQPWNVRSAFTEYGGKPFAGYVGGHGPVIVFCEWSDQRLYLVEPDTNHPEPRPLTPAPERPGGQRYADPQILADRGEVWCVRETFHGAEPTDVTRDIVAIPLDGSGDVRSLMRGQHFLAGPRVAPDRRHLAWIGWDHPDMPWDSSRLCVADLDEIGTPTGSRCVAGGDGVSIAQAEWLDADADTLAFSGDQSGWWNLHTVRADGTEQRCVVPAEEEFGGPLWQPGQRWFVTLPGARLAAVHGDGTNTSLSIYSVSGSGPAAHTATHIPLRHSAWKPTLTAHEGAAVASFAGGPSTPYEVVAVDLATGAEQVVRPEAAPFGAAWLPDSSARTFRGRTGQQIPANVHLPRNPGFAAPDGERPPFIVFVHGGPTGQSSLTYDLEIAYFTSRGFGVVDVDYGGSTGYGRAYRERLRGNWGVVDVEDCADVAAALAAEGVADPGRIAIRGGSAGGWTAACALTSEREAARFRCGTILYPVIDPVAWRAGGTHDFESRYLDGLIGAWPQDEAKYRQRSPIEHADRITAPFVLALGLEDAVCPAEHSRTFLDRIKPGQARFAYLAFEGEQHGFRRSSTIRAALEAELSLYGQVMVGSDPPGVLRVELADGRTMPQPQEGADSA
ncbi:MAG TPA: prolyl oligopeptidase family serine peptidase [Actinocrinis sp.]|jgi:acetyl esterase/lipase